MTKIKKDVQPELPGMPESELLEKGEKYLEAREELEELKGELIEEFIKSGKTSIKVGSHTVKYRHKESNQLIVKVEA